MSVKNSVKAIPMTIFAGASLTNAYQAGTTPLPNPCIIFKIVNNSSKDVTISYDGTTDHDYVPAGTVLLYNFQANSQPNNFVCSLAASTIIYVKAVAGAGTGSVYIIGYYQATNSVI